MTMHLVRGMTSLNTKKAKKAKLTLGKIAKYEEQMRKHNKEMKRLKCPNLIMNLQEYIDYCQGNYKPKQAGCSKNFLGTRRVHPYNRTRA